MSYGQKQLKGGHTRLSPLRSDGSCDDKEGRLDRVAGSQRRFSQHEVVAKGTQNYAKKNIKGDH